MNTAAMKWMGAVALALPMAAFADDKLKESESVRIQSRTESRATAGTAAQTQQTFEGRLVDLHQYMTGSSAAAAGGRVHPMWALDTATGLVILSDPHARPAAAASDAGAKIIEREAQTTRSTARTEVQAGARVEAESKESFESSETTVFGIERRDLDAAENRVKATGTLYTKGGVKYLVVGSMSPAAAGAGIERRSEINRETTILRDTDARPAVEAEGEIDSEVEIEQERDD